MTLKPRTIVTYTAKSGETRQLPKLHGDPKNPNRQVLLDDTRYVIVENTSEGYVEVSK